MRKKYSCKSEFVGNVHIQVMLKVISISILNTHELVETAALKQGIRNPETEYGIRERRFQAINLKKYILAMTIK